MTIVRWNPSQELRPLAQTMPRTIDDFFGGYGWSSPLLPWNSYRGAPNAAWEPFVDVFESADEVVVRAELPGMRREDIELSLENGVLTLQGQRWPDSEDHYHRLERRYGRFTRSFSLPGLLDYDGIRAEYVDGILTVRCPKTESAKPKRIEIAA